MKNLLEKKNSLKSKPFRTKGGHLSKFTKLKLDFMQKFMERFKKVKEFFNFRKLFLDIWSKFFKVVINIDLVIPIPVAGMVTTFVMNVVDVNYAGLSIGLTGSLPRMYLDSDGKLVVELESEFENLLAQFQSKMDLTTELMPSSEAQDQSGILPMSLVDLQDRCGTDPAYAYLFSQGNYKISQLEKKLLLLFNSTRKMNKADYLKFLACLLFMLLALYRSNIGSFDIFLEMLVQAVRRGRISRRLGRFMLNRLRKEGCIVPKQPFE